MDLYALLKDKVTIGFSLRAFGETRKRPDGITEVLPKGIKALTYDCVANPSHDSSVILEMLQENSDAASVVKSLGSTILEETAAIEAKKEMGLIEESGMATQLGETDKPICVGNICSIAPLEEAIEYILDQVVADTSIPNVKVNKF
jgi:hypothetical protein